MSEFLNHMTDFLDILNHLHSRAAAAVVIVVGCVAPDESVKMKLSTAPQEILRLKKKAKALIWHTTESELRDH